MIETIVKVDGMMCGMCESHVNEAVRKAFPEVKRVSSSQAKAQTVIHSEQPLTSRSCGMPSMQPAMRSRA